MKSIEATLTIRNNLLKERRLKMGLTQKTIAEYIGISISEYCAAECLRQIRPTSLKMISDYFCCYTDDLFPEEIKNIRETKFIKYVEYKEISLNAPEAGKINLIPLKDDMEKEIMDGFLRDELTKQLDTLSEREAELVRLYWGIGGHGGKSYREIGKIFKVTGSRIKQVLDKAIRKLRHPSRSKKLREYIT